MLRFFGTFRQRLITENKFGKYLLYAVGEILLVVTGMQIAQQDHGNDRYGHRQVNMQNTAE